MGGKLVCEFCGFIEWYFFVSYGFSLFLGGLEFFDFELLGNIKQFFGEYCICCYIEYFSYCSDYGYFYDLMLILFIEEVVYYVVDCICKVQDFFGQCIGIEYVSYYVMFEVIESCFLGELEFVNVVLEEVDCGLLLDVNNVYVNGINYGYDVVDFICGLFGECIFYVYIVGYFDEVEDFKVDIYGSEVIDLVW